MFHCSVGFLAVLQRFGIPGSWCWRMARQSEQWRPPFCWFPIKAMLTSSYRGFSIATLIIQNLKYTFATSILEEQVWRSMYWSEKYNICTIARKVGGSLSVNNSIFAFVCVVAQCSTVFRVSEKTLVRCISLSFDGMGSVFVFHARISWVSFFLVSLTVTILYSYCVSWGQTMLLCDLLLLLCFFLVWLLICGG